MTCDRRALSIPFTQSRGLPNLRHNVCVSVVLGQIDYSVRVRSQHAEDDPPVCSVAFFAQLAEVVGHLKAGGGRRALDIVVPPKR